MPAQLCPKCGALSNSAFIMRSGCTARLDPDTGMWLTGCSRIPASGVAARYIGTRFNINGEDVPLDEIPRIREDARKYSEEVERQAAAQADLIRVLTEGQEEHRPLARYLSGKLGLNEETVLEALLAYQGWDESQNRGS